MEQGLLFWMLAIAATFVVGAAKGGLPMVGSLSVPLLSLVISPGRAAGLLLPIYILSDLYGLWLYRREYDLKNIMVFVPGGAIGILIGWATASITNDDWVKVMVAVISLAYLADVVRKAYSKNDVARPATVPRGLFWGALAGFTSFVSHSGAPPFNIYTLPQKLPKMVFAGTSTITFAFINWMKLPPYIFLGQVNFSTLSYLVYLAPVALFAAWAGYKLTTIIPSKIFFRAVEFALFISALVLLKEAVPNLLPHR